MQTTLLGLAIAFIIALVTALIGPYFIDWSRFRPQFETEATRIIGLPVRVDGTIDARLLPTPSLRLRSVAIGARFDDNNANAEQLDVEFSLSSLMRGEWRATELTLNGLLLELSLDDRGRMRWSSRPSSIDLGGVTIDHLNVNGTVVLRDASSKSEMLIDDVTFAGDVRALAGSMRGAGSFRLDRNQVPFRISTGRGTDGNGLRLHFNIDPGASPVAADLEGLLTFDEARPHFDGAVAVTRASTKTPDKTTAEDTPWRIQAKVKADPGTIQFEQMETAFGADEVALKLAGSGDLALGAAPKFHAALAAKQLDVDRLLRRDGTSPPSPLQLLTGLRQTIAAMPPPPFESNLEVSADVITLGTRPIQNLTATVHGAAKAWNIDRLEFRAPGATRVAVNGRIAATGSDAGFAGPLGLDSDAPDNLAAWLRGEKDPSYRQQKPLRIHGDVVIAQERIAIDALRAEFDGHAIGGRIAVASPGSGHAKLDAALNARQLDLDALAGLTKTVNLAIDQWPEQAQLTLDVDSAKLFGQDAQPVAVQVSYNPQAISLKQLHIGSSGQTAIDGSGGFDLTTSSGELKLAGSAPSLQRLADLIAPVVPALSGSMRAVPDSDGTARLGATINLDKPQKQRTTLRAAIDLDAPQLKGTLSVTSALAMADVKAINFEKLAHSEGALVAKLTAPQGRNLVALLGLGNAVAVGDGTGSVDATVTGAWSSPLQLKGKLTAGGLDADIDGSANPWQEAATGKVNVVVRQADIAPLLGSRRAGNAPLPLTLTSQVAVNGSKLVLDNLDATVAGSRLRGHFNATLANESRGDVTDLDGEMGVDVIDLPAVLAVLTGAAGSDRNQPLDPALVADWRGRIAFQAVRSTVAGNEIRALRGVIRNDGQTLAVEGLAGNLGGGELTGALSLKQMADNAALTAQLQLKGVDGAALHYRGLAMPAGKVAAQFELNGSGRSAAGLLGGLACNGTVSVAGLQIAGLNPAAFDAAMQASDSGSVGNDAQLQKMIDGSLATGTFTAAAADIPFTLKDAQIRVGNTTLVGEGARLVVSGGYDIGADQVDVRAALSASSVDASVAGRPEIEVLLFGSPDAPARTVDIAALSGWLGLRAIEHETRRLEQLERNGTQSNTQANIPAPPATSDGGTPDIMQAEPPPPLPQPRAGPRRREPANPAPPPAQATIPADPRVPALPPPTEVKPAPGVVRTPPRSRPPLVLTPNASRLSWPAN